LFGSTKQKLDTFKTKIQFQQLLAQALSVEFEFLSSEFEFLKQLFDASLLKIESTSEKIGVTSYKFESTSEKIGVTSYKFESTSEKIGVTSYKFESTSEKIGATSFNFESTSYNDGASSPVLELSELIRQSAGEFLKIYYSQPNIPGRMAEIVLALKEKKRLSVAKMRQMTGVSGNSLGRDLKVRKLLG
jgi:hypothetical protein